MSADRTTHFGYEEVRWEDKARRVEQVFDSVAGRYDVMNDLMSFGVHRLWKRFAIDLAAVRSGDKVLDLAAGTGDLALAMLPRLGPKGQMVLADYNGSMLGVGRDRLLDRGHAQARYVQADAEALPFPEDHFDLVTMAFGLRNVRDKDAALASIYRVLKPGGRLLVLEFSKPRSALLGKAYDAYSFSVLPRMGQAVANDADSYRYLAESIRQHPDQNTLKGMFENAGFERVQVYNMTGGIVALHRGYKL
ncbi:MAG: bifunctional demethylmenaquinone methyltransferase/2-methoxy-6-polyprenyl-1,4-benzoquinol methylase UbiE [Oceanococcaceae bacterium]